MKKQFHLFALFVLLLLGVGCSGKSQSDFRFVFMTDIHIQPELNGVQGFETAIQHVNQLDPQPDFVITGGDHIMDALGVNYTRADSLYKLFLKSCELFEMPVYHTIGNHEVFGIYKKSDVSSEHPEFEKQMFKNRIGQDSTYRSFNHKGWHFMLLDAIAIHPNHPKGKYFGHIDSVQMQWIKDDLSQINLENPIVMVTHIPFVSASAQLMNGAHKGPGDHVIDNAMQVLMRTQKNNVKLVLQGHLHLVESMTMKETTYITGGAVCGAWWKGPRGGFEEGYVVVDVHGNGFNWEYVDFGWDAE